MVISFDSADPLFLEEDIGLDVLISTAFRGGGILYSKQGILENLNQYYCVNTLIQKNLTSSYFYPKKLIFRHLLNCAHSDCLTATAVRILFMR